MPDQTIVSGGSLDLSVPLTSGTNIDFLNIPTASGLLRIEPSAFENRAIVVAGSTAVSTYLGGGIDNFQTGDTIVIASLAAAYAAFDHAPAGVTAAQNAAVATALNNVVIAETLIGPEILTISSGGVVTDNTGLIEGETLSVVGQHVSIPGSIIGYIDTYATSIEQALFNSGSVTSSVFITIGADAIITTDGTIDAICYLRGTALLTPAGEVPVESLAIGDALITRFSGTRRIKWIGEQTFAARFANRNRGKIPVKISAGALGDNLPARDLHVSPGHALLVGGTLLLAKNLVNGITITQDAVSDDIHYYQVEFETHDCVSAHGVWAESYADGPGLRNEFHNVADFQARHPFHITPDQLQLCAPRPQRGPALGRALRPIITRAAAGISPGKLRGYADLIEPSGLIEGWAQDEAYPELPVLLNIYLGETLLGDVLACDHRADLAAAGIGAGNCMFSFRTNQLSSENQQKIQIRRAADNAVLALSGDCQRRVGLPIEPARQQA